MIRLTRDVIVQKYLQTSMLSKKGLWFIAYDLRESNVDVDKFNETLGKRVGAREVPFKDCQIVLLRLNENVYTPDVCKEVYQKFRNLHVDVEFYRNGGVLSAYLGHWRKRPADEEDHHGSHPVPPHRSRPDRRGNRASGTFDVTRTKCGRGC